MPAALGAMAFSGGVGKGCKVRFTVKALVFRVDIHRKII